MLILLLSNPQYHAQFPGNSSAAAKKGHSAAVYNSCVDIKTKTPLWNGKKVLIISSNFLGHSFSASFEEEITEVTG